MKILDACCGSRMFWFDKEHDHALKMGMPIFTLGDWKGYIK